jgi:uncharacterized protein with HEPN domain
MVDFNNTDFFIEQIDINVKNTVDTQIKNRYIGFIAVTAITGYETAVRQIITDFAKSNHEILWNYVTSHLERLNAGISEEAIQERYLKRFGRKYSEAFKSNIQVANNGVMKTERNSNPSAAYRNLIQWRNQFVHTGIIPNTPTFEEAIKAYSLGKYIIVALEETLKPRDAVP